MSLTEWMTWKHKTNERVATNMSIPQFMHGGKTQEQADYEKWVIENPDEALNNLEPVDG